MDSLVHSVQPLIIQRQKHHVLCEGTETLTTYIGLHYTECNWEVRVKFLASVPWVSFSKNIQIINYSFVPRNRSQKFDTNLPVTFCIM
jgi:hypothetical protein